MNQPPSPWRWLLIPLGIIYIIGCIVLLFKVNPALMAQHSLTSVLGKTSKAERVTVLPSPKLQGEFNKSLYAPVNHFRQASQGTNRAPEGLRFYHKILRAEAFKFDSAFANETPLKWIKDKDGFSVVIGARRLVRFDNQLNKKWGFTAEGEKLQLYGPPVVTDQFIFVPSNRGKVYAFNKARGTLKWFLNLKQKIVGPAAIFKSKLFIPTLSADGNHFHLTAIKAHTGESSWQSDKIALKPASTISVDSQKGLLLLGTTGGQIVAIKAANGDIKWRFDSASPVRGAPTIIGDSVYVANDEGLAYGLSLKTGHKQWEYRLTSGSSASFTEIPQSDWIAIMTDEAYLQVINRKDGSGSWRFDCHSDSQQNSVAAIRLENQSITELDLRWRYKGWVIAAPCMSDRMCFFSPRKGRIVHRIRLRGELASPLMFDKEDGGFFALLKNPEGPMTFFKKSADVKMPQWVIGRYLPLDTFRRKARERREKPNETSTAKASDKNLKENHVAKAK